MKVIANAGRPESWPLAEQPCGEFVAAASTIRAGDASVPAHAQFAETCFDPFFRPKSFQSGNQPHEQGVHHATNVAAERTDDNTAR